MHPEISFLDIGELIEVTAEGLGVPRQPTTGIVRRRFKGEMGGGNLTGQFALLRWGKVRHLAIVGKLQEVPDSEIRINLSAIPPGDQEKTLVHIKIRSDPTQPDLEAKGLEAIPVVRRYLESLKKAVTTGTLSTQILNFSDPNTP